jgi:hypothetical protein
MIEALGLKITASRPLEWNYLCTKFHENLPGGSKVISGGTQTGDLISILSFVLGRLKRGDVSHRITPQRYKEG